MEPFDTANLKDIERGIRESRLGFNPVTYGKILRLPVPELTQERRKEMVKIMTRLGEEGRVAVRHARGDANTKIKKLEKIAEDDRTRGEKDLQKLTDEHIKQIDQLIAAKEAEIMEV